MPTDAKAVQWDCQLKLVVSDALGYHGITNNLANGPQANRPYGKDPRVRKAFELSIDRTALINVVFNGLYPASAQAIPSTSPYHDAALLPPGRDIAKAKALLREAGVTTPLTVNLSVVNSPDSVQTAEVIQSMAAEAGFDVKIKAMEARALLNAALQGDFEASIGYWSGRIDPDGNMYAFLHSGAPLNEGHYSNAAFDSLLDQARQVTDVDTRRDIYQKAWTIAARDSADYLSVDMEKHSWDVSEDTGLRADSRRFDPRARTATRALTVTHRSAGPMRQGHHRW